MHIPKITKKFLGNWGENSIDALYTKQNYKVLSKNTIFWKSKQTDMYAGQNSHKGEIDRAYIHKDKKNIVVCEVKTCFAKNMGHLQTILATRPLVKQNQLHSLWLAQKKYLSWYPGYQCQVYVWLYCMLPNKSNTNIPNSIQNTRENTRENRGIQKKWGSWRLLPTSFYTGLDAIAGFKPMVLYYPVQTMDFG
jgi:Holliday junction resolvase-like predicted endonuclease